MEPGKQGARAYFDVDDINAGAARVKELGGEADEPMPVPGMGWFSTCTDPHGNEFGLWQHDPSAPAPAGKPRRRPAASLTTGAAAPLAAAHCSPRLASCRTQVLPSGSLKSANEP